jgi:ATP-dependent protease ClpP protease subunit
MNFIAGEVLGLTELTAESAYEPLLIARTALVESQRIGQEHDNDLAASLAETARIALAKEIRRDIWEKAGENFHRIAHLTQEIESDSVGIWIDALSRWDRIDSVEEAKTGKDPQIYRLVLCSPGGDLVSGMAFYSFLKGLTERRPVHISASGLCASMATVIHQAGTVRLIERGCSYLIHEASSKISGRSDTIHDQAGWLAAMNDRLRQFLAEKSNLTAEEIKERSNRREWWLDENEVVELGFADRIGYLQ